MNYARKVLSYQKYFPVISSIIFEKRSKLAATFHVLSYTVTLLYRLRVTSDEQFLNQLESRSDFAIQKLHILEDSKSLKTGLQTVANIDFSMI